MHGESNVKVREIDRALKGNGAERACARACAYVGISEIHNDQTEGGKGFVNVLGLIQHITFRTSLRHFLRTSQIDQVQLACLATTMDGILTDKQC